jgi:hypothetical protein
MIFPQVELQEWIDKWGLEIADYECPTCKKTFKTTIPVMTKDSAGLVTPDHDCGPGHWKVVMTPRTEEAKEFWNKII